MTITPSRFHGAARIGRAALLFTTGIVLGCTGDAAPAAITVIPIELAVARDGSTSEPVVVTGRYTARDEVSLAFKTGGVIARVSVDEGEIVREGQQLAELDVREIDAAVAAARVGVEKAQRDYDRVQRLSTDSIATRSQVEDAASVLELARAALAQARVNREYSVITAPQGGVIQQRVLTAGALAAPGPTVLQLGGMRRGAVLRAGLADRDAMRVHPGDVATVQFPTVDRASYMGRVLLVGRAADPRTGTYTVDIVLRDAAALPLGLVGSVRIEPRQSAADRARGVAVPMTALLEPDGDSATVLVMASVMDSVPTSRRVRLLGTVDDDALLDGIAPGTLVVARGAAYVTPGVTVRVTPTRHASTRHAESQP
jgi:RND family efflux transporter MFP subunit